MSKRILVVEDQPDNRQIIRDMLAPSGGAPVGKRFRNIDNQCPLVKSRNIGADPSGGGIGLEPMLFKILLPHHALHSILSI